MAVASAGPYASPHLAPDRQPHQHPTTLFFTFLMPFPTNGVKALKAYNEHVKSAGVCQHVGQQLSDDTSAIFASISVVLAASVVCVCVQLMRCYEDPVTDGDDDDRVIHCKSKHRSYRSRSVGIPYLLTVTSSVV